MWLLVVFMSVNSRGLLLIGLESNSLKAFYSVSSYWAFSTLNKWKRNRKKDGGTQFKLVLKENRQLVIHVIHLFLCSDRGNKSECDVFLLQVVTAIVESGKSMSADQKKTDRCPLLYEWHKKQYIGAAHGMAGIYYMLMQVRAKRLNWYQKVWFYLGLFWVFWVQILWRWARSNWNPRNQTLLS